jgi:RNase H-like domain found in reverse transcriptase
MMVPPRAGAKKQVVTDASNMGPFFCKRRRMTNGRPLGTFLASCKGGKPRYTTTEKEAGAFVWAIRKWKHHLDGQQFEAVTDHIALRWLMNLKLPHFRLANWVLNIQALGFVVLHAAGNGELMSVPDALTRDFVEGSVLCERCLEVVAVVDEEGTA